MNNYYRKYAIGGLGVFTLIVEFAHYDCEILIDRTYLENQWDKMNLFATG